MTTLDDKQRNEVARWIADGQKLADIQKRLETEFNIRMTYLDVRLLVDDLKLVPKDPEVAPAPVAKPASEQPVQKSESTPAAATDQSTPASGAVTVSVDAVTRSGALVSGKVTFSDGQSAEWYLDQMGRLGLLPKQQGYRPSQADVQAFQAELQGELARMGF